MARQRSSPTGFTLIELLVAVSLTIILLLSASALFMVFIISSNKIDATQLVKTEGQYALNQIEFLLRNALELQPNTDGVTCDANMDEISFVSLDGNTTYIFAEDDEGVQKIASNSGVYLTSDSVTLVSGPEFDCTVGADNAQPHITVSFTLRKGAPGVDQARDIVEESFTTSTTLRSY